MCTFIHKAIIINKIIPVASRLVTDPSEYVREGLACSVNEMAAVLGRDDTVEYVLPMLLTLLRDECAEVRDAA